MTPQEMVKKRSKTPNKGSGTKRTAAAALLGVAPTGQSNKVTVNKKMAEQAQMQVFSSKKCPYFSEPCIKERCEAWSVPFQKCMDRLRTEALVKIAGITAQPVQPQGQAPVPQ